MRKHIENTDAKAWPRLNIVKKLASPKWGANTQALRQLCMGYVRPTLEYSSAALSTATHTNLATLEKVQNQALRFINGAMNTTPTSASGIEYKIEPLDIRRDAAIVTTYERYQRLEHHPNTALMQTWRKKTRIKQQSYLTRATSHYLTAWVQSAMQKREDSNSSSTATLQNSISANPVPTPHCEEC